MKTFEYAKTKATKKHFTMPSIKFDEYDIPLWVLPIAPFLIIGDKVSKWHYKRQEWDEAKATKALNYFLPYVMQFSEEDNAYYYCTEWSYTGSHIAKRVPLSMKTWARKFGFETLQYLENQYEKEGFTKTKEDDYYETWIKFEKIN